MTTIVCHNIVSCFDSQFTETTTTLNLKLQAEVKLNLEFDFLQTIPKESTEKQSVYTYRLATKSPFSSLSSKSLEICTENLGSESGSDIVAGSSTGILSSSAESNTSNSIEKSKQETKSSIKPDLEDARSCRRIKNFPPPLTTMSGASSLQVRRHTDGGRLIIDAVEAPSGNSCFQAERSDGRLRLRYLTSSDTETSSPSGSGEMAAAEEIDERRCENESEEEESDGEMNLEIGIEKFDWVRRCNEGNHGNKGLLCSNSFWVATS